VIDEEILGLVCCPVTRMALRPATAEELASLAAKVDPAAFVPGEALATEDGSRVYPIENGIPILLPEAGIA